MPRTLPSVAAIIPGNDAFLLNGLPSAYQTAAQHSLLLPAAAKMPVPHDDGLMVLPAEPRDHAITRQHRNRQRQQLFHCPHCHQQHSFRASLLRTPAWNRHQPHFHTAVSLDLLADAMNMAAEDDDVLEDAGWTNVAAADAAESDQERVERVGPYDGNQHFSRNSAAVHAGNGLASFPDHTRFPNSDGNASRQGNRVAGPPMPVATGTSIIESALEKKIEELFHQVVERVAEKASKDLASQLAHSMASTKTNKGTIADRKTKPKTKQPAQPTMPSDPTSTSLAGTNQPKETNMEGAATGTAISSAISTKPSNPEKKYYSLKTRPKFRVDASDLLLVILIFVFGCLVVPTVIGVLANFVNLEYLPIVPPLFSTLFERLDRLFDQFISSSFDAMTATYEAVVRLAHRLPFVN